MNDSSNRPDRVCDGPPAKPDIRALFEEGKPIDEAVQRAAREAVLLHKKLGNPVATWKDGKVVWIPPEQIRVDG